MTDSRGEIYDLGYRNYDGPRLGRSYAVRSLLTMSVRNTFGLGRGPMAKFLAFALTFFAFVPAIVQLVIGAIVPVEDFTFVAPEELFGSIQVILVLFVAAMASELVGNDRKNNTLVLYFSRPIEKEDYVLAKIGALTVALLALTLLPQMLLFLGNWLGAGDGSTWIADNWTDLFPIVAASVLVSAQLASGGILVAALVTKRAFALVSVLGGMLVSWIATEIVVELTDAGSGSIPVVLLSPLHVARGATLVLFGAVPDFGPGDFTGGDMTIGALDLPGFVWIVAIVAHIAIFTALAVRKYQRSV
jgi:ABC-2 type transport system permease protein